MDYKAKCRVILMNSLRILFGDDKYYYIYEDFFDSFIDNYLSNCYDAFNLVYDIECDKEGNYHIIENDELDKLYYKNAKRDLKEIYDEVPIGAIQIISALAELFCEYYDFLESLNCGNKKKIRH